MAWRAGSMLSRSIVGRTLSTTWTVRPGRRNRAATAAATSALQATTTSSSAVDAGDAAALSSTLSRWPPSVPPQNSSTSGTDRRRAGRGRPSSRSPAATSSTLAPALSAACRPASGGQHVDEADGGHPQSTARARRSELVDDVAPARSSCAIAAVQRGVVAVHDIGADGRRVVGRASSRPEPSSTSVTLVNVLPKSERATTRIQRARRAAQLAEGDDEIIDGRRDLDAEPAQVVADIDGDVRTLDVLVEHAAHEHRR